MRMLLLIILVLLLQQIGVSLTLKDTRKGVVTNDEEKLFDHLFLSNKNYSVSVRPVTNKSLPIMVNLSMSLVQIIELNDRDQSLKSSIWIRQSWKNDFLTWNASEYGGIEQITVNKKWVWKPDLVLYNSVEGSLNGQMDQHNTRIIIREDGTHYWYTPAIVESGCSINIKYFPFDVQYCALQFGSWSYTSPEMDLKLLHGIDVSFYQESSDFLLKQTKAERNSVKYSCCPYEIVDITFTLTLERQAGYYVFNVIIPTIVLTSFTALTFLFPVTTGERMGLAIECFLTISILMMMVSDLMPIDSNMTSLLGNFMLTCIFTMTSSLMMNAVCLNLHRLTEVPTWLHVLAFHKIRLTVMVSSCWQSISKRGMLNPRAICEGIFAATMFKLQDDSSHVQHLIHNKQKSSLNTNEDYRKLCKYCMLASYRTQNSSKNQRFEKDFKMFKAPSLTEDVRNMRTLVKNLTDEQDANKTSRLWQCFAQTMDRFFFLVFFFIYIFVAIGIILQAPVL